MIIDGRSINKDALIECEVCIVGAGPAGLAAAAEFLDQDISVCLLESGDFDRDEATEMLSDCTVEENADLYPNARSSRDRRIGGTSAQWDVMVQGALHIHVSPLEPIDFDSRPWLAHSGWPIDYRVLRPFYSRAQATCDAGPFDYRAQSWADDANRPFSFEGGRLDSKMLATSPQNMFQRTLPHRIAASDSVKILTWSNAVDLQTDAGANSVRAVRVSCLGGNRYRVAARMVILAQGGFEVPRLLLASNSIAKAGLGNDHDLVGRFLMDRQIVKTGLLVPPTPAGLRRFGFYDMRRVHGSNMLGKLMLSPETLSKEQILSSLISFSPTSQSLLHVVAQRPFGRGTTFRAPAYASARALMKAIRQKRLPLHPLRHVARVLAGLDDLLYIKLLRIAAFRSEFNLDVGGWSALPDFERRFSALDVHQMCEQAPDPRNRIMLTDNLDATGMPTTHIRLRWNDIDIRSIIRSQEILKEDIERAGLGRLHIDRRGELPVLAQMSCHHPAGTTRMAIDPKQGVVNADCRVHGLANLFVASSSVFPTSGHVPPTLTIIALAIRICDKIKNELAPASAHFEVQAPEAVH